MSLKQAFAGWLYNLVMEQHQQAAYKPCRWCQQPLPAGSAFCNACGWQQQRATGPIQRLPLQLPAAATQVSEAALRPPQQRTEELQRMAEMPTRHMLPAVKPVQPVKSYPGQRLAAYNRQQRREGK